MHGVWDVSVRLHMRICSGLFQRLSASVDDGVLAFRMSRPGFDVRVDEERLPSVWVLLATRCRHG